MLRQQTDPRPPFLRPNDKRWHDKKRFNSGWQLAAGTSETFVGKSPLDALRNRCVTVEAENVRTTAPETSPSSSRDPNAPHHHKMVTNINTNETGAIEIRSGYYRPTDVS